MKPNLFSLCVIFAIVSGKRWKEDEFIERIKNPTGVIIHERATLYGAEKYMTLKAIINLADWKNQEQIYQRDLTSLIQQQENTQVDYMEALKKSAEMNLQKRSVGRWIDSLKQTIQPLKAILKTEVATESISTKNYDDKTDTLYLTDGCPRVQPYIPSDESDKLKDLIDLLKAAEQDAEPTKEEKKGSAIATVTTAATPSQAVAIFNASAELNKNKAFVNMIEKRIEVTNVIEVIQEKIENMDEVITNLNRNQLPTNCLSEETWTEISQHMKIPEDSKTKALQTMKWAIGKFGLTLYEVEGEKIHLEVLIPYPMTTKKMNLIDLEYYPIQKNGKHYEQIEQPNKMIVSKSFNWHLSTDTEEKMDESCIVSSRTPNQFWCFGLKEEALPKDSCLKESLGNEINLEECYVTS